LGNANVLQPEVAKRSTEVVVIMMMMMTTTTVT
jgi:hypothetical protein